MCRIPQALKTEKHKNLTIEKANERAFTNIYFYHKPVFLVFQDCHLCPQDFIYPFHFKHYLFERLHPIIYFVQIILFNRKI